MPTTVKVKRDMNEIKSNSATPEQWVCNYADYLYNFAYCRINDDELARDLVQETFLSALEKVQSFEGRSTEKTWLTSILKYKIIDIYRSRSSFTYLPQHIDESDKQNPFFQQLDGHWNVEDRPKDFGIEDASNIESKEIQQILKQCLNKLPQLWYNVFVMKFIDEEQSNNICKELKITTSNYWVIIHRAKLNLRACLQKNWC